VSCDAGPPSTDRLNPPDVALLASVESTDAGTVWPSGSLAGTNVNAFDAPLKAFSCCSGLIASRPMKPVDASFVGSAIVWFAFAPVTRIPPFRSPLVIGSVPPSFFSSVAPSSEYFSTIAASPFFVPSTGVPLVGPAGRFAVPDRSPLIPPGFAHEAVLLSHPSRPKRSSW
jgi:hypothetical protein